MPQVEVLSLHTEGYFYRRQPGWARDIKVVSRQYALEIKRKNGEQKWKELKLF